MYWSFGRKYAVVCAALLAVSGAAHAQTSDRRGESQTIPVKAPAPDGVGTAQLSATWSETRSAAGIVATPHDAIAAATRLEHHPRGWITSAITAAALTLVSGDDGEGNAGSAGMASVGTSVAIGITGTTGPN